jgi:predicted nucleic acid-binding protein
VSTRIFLDTLFVVALVNQRDQHHVRATQLADRYEGRQFLVTDAVLLEIGNALARNFKEQAIKVLDDLLTSDDVQVVHLTPALFDAAYSLFRRHRDKSWGLVDCVSFVAMTQEGVTESLTFDQHFSQAGFQTLMRDTGL